MNPLAAVTNILIQRARKAFRFYYEIVYALGTPRHVNTMNYGYAPISDDLRQYYPADDQGLQYELYWQTFNQLEQPLDSTQVLCEIACGRGGGLAFLRNLTDAKIIGLEQSRSARSYARSHFQLDVRPASAPVLPLDDESIDLFLSVESAHLYHNDQFVTELNRCLKPGGTVLLADCNLGPDRQIHDWLISLYSNNGLTIDNWRDIRPNVLQSLEQDEPRKLEFLNRLPGFLREEASLYMGLVNSPKYNEMKQDKRAYFMLRAKKDASA